MPDRVLAVTPDRGFTNNITVHQNDKSGPVVAKERYRMFTEQGTITLSQTGERYKVTRPFFSYTYKLQLDEPRAQPVIVAKLSLALKTRMHTFKIQVDDESYEMKRQEDRLTYQVSRLGTDVTGSATASKVGQVRSDTPKTGHYSVVFDEGVRLDLVLFCLWLVRMLNTRVEGARITSLGIRNHASSSIRTGE